MILLGLPHCLVHLTHFARIVLDSVRSSLEPLCPHS